MCDVAHFELTRTGCSPCDPIDQLQVEPVAYSTSNPAAYPRLKLVCSLPAVETIRVVAKNIGITPNNYADVSLTCFCDANHILLPDGASVSHNVQMGTIVDDTFLHNKIL